MLVDALCAGAKAGSCGLTALDLAGNQLTVGVIDPLSRLLSSLTSLLELSLMDNAFVAGLTVVNGLRVFVTPSEVVRALPGLLNNLPAAMHAGSKAKDLLIAVLSSTSLCELHVDGGFFGAEQTARLQQRLARNRELRQTTLAHSELGADAPPTLSAAGSQRSVGRAVRSALSWGRHHHGAAHASTAEVPVLGVLFSAPLVCMDPSGQVVPMDMLDLEKEKELICDSMREARRNVKVRFEFATTDRLRTLVTLGQCCGLHYSGHGDPNFLSMEDGRGNAHFVRAALLDRKRSRPSVLSLVHRRSRCPSSP